MSDLVLIAIINAIGFSMAAGVGVANTVLTAFLTGRTAKIETRTTSIEEKVDGTATAMQAKLDSMEAQLKGAHLTIAEAVGRAAGIAETEARK